MTKLSQQITEPAPLRNTISEYILVLIVSGFYTNMILIIIIAVINLFPLKCVRDFNTSDYQSLYTKFSSPPTVRFLYSVM